jgi:hypothetical protein
MQRHAKVPGKTSAGQEWAGTLSWCERHKCIQTSRSNRKFPSSQNFPKFSMSMALNLGICLLSSSYSNLIQVTCKLPTQDWNLKSSPICKRFIYA